FPSRLMAVWWDGLLIALALMLVARPVAVLLTATPFNFDRRELAMVSWVGLKGAVPITLATFPLMMGVPGAEVIFDVVFFVVLLSALTQGVTLAPIARRLGLELPFTAPPPASLEISALKHINGDIIDYVLTSDAAAVGRPSMGLVQPRVAGTAMAARGQDSHTPRVRAHERLGRCWPYDHAPGPAAACRHCDGHPGTGHHSAKWQHSPAGGRPRVRRDAHHAASGGEPHLRPDRAAGRHGSCAGRVPAARRRPSARSPGIL